MQPAIQDAPQGGNGPNEDQQELQKNPFLGMSANRIHDKKIAILNR